MSIGHHDHPLSRGLKIAITAVIALLLALMSIFLLLGKQTGLDFSPGFFGTRARLYADIDLSAQIILLAGLSIGAFFARKGKISTHQYNQTAWVAFNIILTLLIMIIGFKENIAAGFPANLNQPFVYVPTIHAAIGSLAILTGIYIILRMNRWLPAAWRIAGWKKLMRLALAFYWVVGVMGMVIYTIWYIL